MAVSHAPILPSAGVLFVQNKYYCTAAFMVSWREGVATLAGQDGRGELWLRDGTIGACSLDGTGRKFTTGTLFSAGRDGTTSQTVSAIDHGAGPRVPIRRRFCRSVPYRPVITANTVSSIIHEKPGKLTPISNTHPDTPQAIMYLKYIHLLPPHPRLSGNMKFWNVTYTTLRPLNRLDRCKRWGNLNAYFCISSILPLNRKKQL